MYQESIYEVDGSVAVITMNRRTDLSIRRTSIQIRG